jgi:uncharacterized protein YoxC
MTFDSLSTTNLWLGIIATVTVIEFAMLVVAGVMILRLYRKITVTIDEVKQQHIAPIAAKVDHIVAQVQDVTDRVKRADDSVRAAVGRVEDAAGRVFGVAKHAWPVAAGWRAVGAAVATFVNGGRSTRTPPSPALPARRTGTESWRAR